MTDEISPELLNKHLEKQTRRRLELRVILSESDLDEERAKVLALEEEKKNQREYIRQTRGWFDINQDKPVVKEDLERIFQGKITNPHKLYDINTTAECDFFVVNLNPSYQRNVNTIGELLEEDEQGNLGFDWMGHFNYFNSSHQGHGIIVRDSPNYRYVNIYTDTNNLIRGRYDPKNSFFPEDGFFSQLKHDTREFLQTEISTPDMEEILRKTLG